MTRATEEPDRMDPSSPLPAANQAPGQPVPEIQESPSPSGPDSAAGAPGEQQGLTRPAVAAPGRPDGEVDTRV